MKIQINKDDDVNDFIGISSIESETVDSDATQSFRITKKYAYKLIRFLVSIGVDVIHIQNSKQLLWISFVLPSGWILRI